MAFDFTAANALRLTIAKNTHLLTSELALKPYELNSVTDFNYSLFVLTTSKDL